MSTGFTRKEDSKLLHQKVISKQQQSILKMLQPEFTRREQSILLYLETCLVDEMGRVEGRRMNGEDMAMIKKLIKTGLIEFGRISFKSIEKLRVAHGYGKVYTHWVRFSDKAWKLVSKWRKERSDRMITKNKIKLLSELP